MKSFALAVTISLGCSPGHAALLDSARADSLARADQDSVNRAQPGYIVDSILPIEEQLRRFRVGLTEVPSQFVGGEASREELVAQFMRRLEARDTASLVRMTVSKTEFAYLVYPESPNSREPYRQSPDLVWLQHSAASGTGLTRLLERLPGSGIAFHSLTCDPQPVREGSNRIWRNCAVRFAPRSGEATSLRLFAGIIERAGRFKILSYANAF